MEIKLTIPGRPIPKGRPRATYRKGHAILYTPRTTKEAERYIAVIAKRQIDEPLKGALEAEVTFYFKPGRKKYSDLDNLQKLVFDSLNSIAYADDSQIVHIKAWRLMDADERTELTIREVR